MVGAAVPLAPAGSLGTPLPEAAALGNGFALTEGLAPAWQEPEGHEEDEQGDARANHRQRARNADMRPS